MNNILTQKGEYLQPRFKGPTGTWNLIGTESSGKKADACVDAFKNEATGKYQIMKRSEVYKLAEEGKIF